MALARYAAAKTASGSTTRTARARTSVTSAAPAPGSSCCANSTTGHKEACTEVDRIIGTEYRPPALSTQQSASPAKIVATERLLAEADAPDVVTNYLASRGLSVTSEVLVGHHACPYFDDESRRLIGRFPAVLAPILAADGTQAGVGAAASGARATLVWTPAARSP